MPNHRNLDVADAEPAFLTLKGAATLLNLHPNTVRAQVTRGIIPGAKIGRHWRFLKADLVAWTRGGYSAAARMQLIALNEATRCSTDVQASVTLSSQQRTEQALDELLAQSSG